MCVTATLRHAKRSTILTEINLMNLSTEKKGLFLCHIVASGIILIGGLSSCAKKDIKVSGPETKTLFECGLCS